MKHLALIITLLTLILISCSTPFKQDKIEFKDTTISPTGQTSITATDASSWTTYKDKVNIGFMVTFKYPKKLFAEHFENAECIGKKIKMVDDGPMTSMDCCMWMDDISEGKIKSIDTLVQYDIQKFKADKAYLKDTIEVANVKATRVRLFAKNDKTTELRQSVYFTKYDTFFEINNDRLMKKDFETFLQSIKIDK